MRVTLGEIAAHRAVRSARSSQGGPGRERAGGHPPPGGAAARRAEGNAGPRELLVKIAMPKARYWAGKYSRLAVGGIEFDDLFQEGCLAIVLAVRRYDATESASFTTFASACARGAVLEYIYDHRTAVRLPQSQQGAKARGEGKLGRLRCYSLDAPRGHDSDSTWVDTLAGPEGSNDGALSNDSRLLAQVIDAIDTLPSRERELLRARYIDERSYTSIGHELGVHLTYARHLEAEALDLLRRILAVRALDRLRPPREKPEARPVWRTSWVIDAVLQAQNRVGGPVTSAQALRAKPLLHRSRTFTSLAHSIVRLGPDERGRVLHAVGTDPTGHALWWVAEPNEAAHRDGHPDPTVATAPEWKSTQRAAE